MLHLFGPTLYIYVIQGEGEGAGETANSVFVGTRHIIYLYSITNGWYGGGVRKEVNYIFTYCSTHQVRCVASIGLEGLSWRKICIFLCPKTMCVLDIHVVCGHRWLCWQIIWRCIN